MHGGLSSDVELDRALGLAGDLQQILQHVTDELATEVNREQQHLMLMQSQVRSAPCHPALPAVLLLFQTAMHA